MMPFAFQLGKAALAVALLASVPWSVPARAQGVAQDGVNFNPPSPIEILSFPGTTNLPVWVAQDKGLFARNGIVTKILYAQGVAAQMVDVMSGKYPLFITAMDNIIAYQEGQGTATLPAPPDLFAFMGVHHGLNSLVVKPELMTYQHLRGHTMGVDNLTSGYAFVLYRLLERNDLERDVDYNVVPLGSPAQRFEALKEGRIDGTLLAMPNDDEAAEAGFTILAEPSDLTGGYQGSVYGTRRSWANSHPREMTALVRSLVAAHDYIRADKAGAVAVLRAHIKGLSSERADLVYRGLAEEKNGLAKRGAINIEGVKNVMRLRSDMGTPKKKLTDPYRYIDMSYFRDVVGK